MVKQGFVIGLVALFLFTIEPVFAQPEGQGMPGQEMSGMRKHKKMTPEEMAKKDEERIAKRLEEMTKNLGLTPEQQVQVRGIMTATSAEIRKLMQETRVIIEGFMEKDRAAIKALLTEEQQKTLEAMRPKPGEGQVPPPPGQGQVPPAPQAEGK